MNKKIWTQTDQHRTYQGKANQITTPPVSQDLTKWASGAETSRVKSSTTVITSGPIKNFGQKKYLQPYPAVLRTISLIMENLCELPHSTQ